MVLWGGRKGGPGDYVYCLNLVSMSGRQVEVSLAVANFIDEEKDSLIKGRCQSLYTF